MRRPPHRLVRELNELTDDGAGAAIEAAFAPLRAAYDDASWEEMGAQREAYLVEHEAARERSAARRAECPICGAQGTLHTAPRLLGGCHCGGGTCGADTCACPWDGSRPAPPTPSTEALQRNATEWGYVELPLGDPCAPTILIVGDTRGTMARACTLAFPAELCLTVSYRTRRKSEHGLYWCGDMQPDRLQPAKLTNPVWPSKRTGQSAPANDAIQIQNPTDRTHVSRSSTPPSS